MFYYNYIISIAINILSKLLCMCTHTVTAKNEERKFPPPPMVNKTLAQKLHKLLTSYYARL